MSKIGVGIGEDFPVDDSKPSRGEESSGGRQCDAAEYAARLEAYRKWREQRREWRRRSRDAWRARKQSLRHTMQHYSDVNYDELSGHAFYWRGGIAWGALVLLVAIVVYALISFIFSHIFVIAGVVALLALFAAYHRGFEPFDLPTHDYSNNTPAPREVAH